MYVPVNVADHRPPHNKTQSALANGGRSDSDLGGRFGSNPGEPFRVLVAGATPVGDALAAQKLNEKGKDAKVFNHQDTKTPSF